MRVAGPFLHEVERDAGSDRSHPEAVPQALSGWQTLAGMAAFGMTTLPNPYRGCRFPAEIIEHAVWLYHCFSLSLRDVETILAARGVLQR